MILLGNEREVGQGIRASGVPREEIFITSKLWNTDHPNVKEGLRKTLEALGTDYLDLYVSRCAVQYLARPRPTNECHQLIHWPVRLVPVSTLLPLARAL